MNRTLVSLVVAAVSVTAAAASSPLLYTDPAQPIEVRVDDLVSRLTLEEKASLLDFRASVDRLGIPADGWNQCLQGVQWTAPTTSFPSCVAMAATWNPALIHEIATVISDEARAIYNERRRQGGPAGRRPGAGLIYRAPVLDLARNPRWGRIHETFGEDAFLAARMGVAYIRGLQGNDPRHLKIAAVVKHMAAYDSDAGRGGHDVRVSAATLHDYWLQPFRAAVTEADLQGLMPSYIALNGAPTHANRWLLTELVRDDWRFQGMVVAEGGSMKSLVTGHGGGKMTMPEAVALSFNAGCDFGAPEFREFIPDAVRQGAISELRLDEAIERVLRVRVRLGEFDPPDSVAYSHLGAECLASPAHRAVARKAAREAIVLLQNRDDLLPLDKTKLSRVAVLGPLADRVVTTNFSGVLGAPVTALQGLRRSLPATAEITSAPGANLKAAPEPDEEQIADAAALARSADVAFVFVGTDNTVEQEGRDRTSLGLPGNQLALVRAAVAANPRTIVVLLSAGPVIEPWLKENVPTLLQGWWLGETGGDALADVFFGATNPAGRLPYTIYASAEQVPSAASGELDAGFTYRHLTAPPLFPFGHGLSYTRFEYSNLRAQIGGATAQPSIAIEVDIANTGSLPGDEVAQLYLQTPAVAASPSNPKLAAFQRLTLRPGEKQTAKFVLGRDQLDRWNEARRDFVVAAEEFQIAVGASSADLRLNHHVRLKF